MRYFVFLNRHGEALKHYDGTVDPARMIMTVGDEIEYNADEEDDDAKPRRKSYLKRKMAKGTEETQRD